MNPIFRTAAIAGIAMSFSGAAYAQSERPVATATFTGGSVAAGVGYTWGNGVLSFKGKNYPFTVQGLSVVDVGITHITGKATIYNLKTVDGFAGNYVAAGAGATLAGGGSVAIMQNQNGVIVHFTSTTTGLKLNLSGSGITVKLGAAS